ncbi:ABC-2 type transport system permease protein [Terribacillus saccharophilus]|uniref:ABC-2 type transport system permease protein n=1 Tax=Terribacillus saccharophilus TaxID=361277 RepID=A0A075LFM9_9BACI|nr:ABC transporter permease [Terribacillus goriensis]AIF65234.1 multidrug ABC transporter permease [Terribacillus goriensis]SEN80285.1 ABC-2 type transport system permease protein [Terribacillus saccharophilus]
MKSVLWAQFLKDKRNPLLILLFIAGSIVATLILGGGVQSVTTVAIFSEEANASEIEEKWGALLNTNDSFKFEIVDPEEAREDVRDGSSDVAVNLSEDDYRLLVSKRMPGVSYVEQHVASVFQQEVQISAVESQEDGNVRDEMEEYLADAPFQLESQGVDGEQIPKFNIRTQLLFAFTFLISMFIIGFKVNNVTQDRVSGIWDRMILSPVKKTGMYSGYLLYSFLITMLQIVVVLIMFKYVMDYDVGNNLWLIILISACFTFGMISIAMLITGFVRTPEQFYAIYPSLIPLIPLVSGAYMMPGTITNPVLLFIADLFPNAHAMEAIMSVVFYGAGLQEVTMSLLYMLLIGIVAMGVGINLVERRSS